MHDFDYEIDEIRLLHGYYMQATLSCQGYWWEIYDFKLFNSDGDEVTGWLTEGKRNIMIDGQPLIDDEISEKISMWVAEEHNDNLMNDGYYDDSRDKD